MARVCSNVHGEAMVVMGGAGSLATTRTYDLILA
jgi:hypothetical protein